MGLAHWPASQRRSELTCIIAHLAAANLSVFGILQRERKHFPRSLKRSSPEWLSEGALAGPHALLYEASVQVSDRRACTRLPFPPTAESSQGRWNPCSLPAAPRLQSPSLCGLSGV